MLKKLKQAEKKRYYIKNGVRTYGVHEAIIGDVTGIKGDMSDITGDLAACNLTAEDRARCVNINDLIGE